MLSFLNDCQIIDLSHSLSEQNPTWTGDCGFHSKIDKDFSEIGARVMSYELIAGVGTHMDSPLHFAPNGPDISSIELKNLVAPLCVIRVSAGNKQDYFLSKEDVLGYERRFGAIPTKSFIAADTGWAKNWKSQEKYRNLDSNGAMHFPGISVEAAELLLEKNIVGLGIDTLSPDGSNMEFPLHHLLLTKGKYFIENMANLDILPESDAWIVALPPKIKKGAESPCRCIAIVPTTK